MDEEQSPQEMDARGLMQIVGVLAHRAGGKLVITEREITAMQAGGPYDLVATTDEDGNAVLHLQPAN